MIDWSSLLPKLTSATDLGSMAVAAYARRDGVDVDEYLERLGPGPTAEQVGKDYHGEPADAAAVLFTEDATYAEQPYQDAFAGPAAVREYWARVTATQSNIEMRYGTPISVGNRTAVEWWTTLVNDGAPITLAGAFILTFDASGRCRSLREYWQFTAGTHEPKPGWGS